MKTVLFFAAIVVCGCSDGGPLLANVVGADGAAIELRAAAIETDAPVTIALTKQGRVWLGRAGPPFTVVAAREHWALATDGPTRQVIMIWDAQEKKYLSVATTDFSRINGLFLRLRAALPEQSPTALRLYAFP